MRFVSFRHRDRVCAGLVVGEDVLDLVVAARAQAFAAGVDLSSVLALIRGGDLALTVCRRLEATARSAAGWLRAADVQLLAPIPQPLRNVFCVGRNYLDHAREAATAMRAELKLPEAPQFFSKATHTVIGPSADVRLDARVTRRLDYEVELAVVIGRGGRDIQAEAAWEHVFGYTVANDVTARDLQRRHDQWFKGKSLDTTLPLGPWIVDRAALGEVSTLELTLHVNGEERQRARVAQMIFDIPTLIASLSAGLTLESGDVIATGTPSGVGFAMHPPQYLRDGDDMLARIDRIGELRNRVVQV